MKLLGISQNDLAKSPKVSFSQPQVIDTLALKNSDVSIACCMSVNYFGGSYFQIAIFCLAVMIVIFIILSIFMYLSFRDILSYPVTRIASAAESIGQNDISSFIECNESNILEFEEINRALAHLISQKVELEKLNQLEKYEKIMPCCNISNSRPAHIFLLIV